MILNESNAVVVLTHLMQGRRLAHDNQVYCLLEGQRVGQVLTNSEGTEYIRDIPMTVSSFLQICSAISEGQVSQMAIDLFKDQIREAR